MLKKRLSKFERIVRGSDKRLDLTKNLLCSIAFGEKEPLGFSKNKKVVQAFSGLRRYKFVRHTRDNNYYLTEKGERVLRDIIIDSIQVKKRGYWNGKWYLVMYDLPIRFKKAREAFRWKLKNLGFFQFQKSAWIFPYPCEQEILLVADFFGIRKYIQILEVGKVLDDKKLRAHYDL